MARSFVSSPFFYLLLFVSHPGSAYWEQALEYTTLSEEEAFAFDNPSTMDSEYQSDLLTYSKPLEWDYHWLKNKKSLDTSVGSISSEHFVINNRLKIYQDLTEKLQFRWISFHEEDRETNHSADMIELLYTIYPKWGLALYGEPAHFKRKNDAGLAIYWFPTEYSEIKFFHTYVDITRATRNDQSDFFVKPYFPYASGFVAKFWSVDTFEFLQFGIRNESKTQWNFPDELRLYEFQKKVLLSSLRKKMSDSLFLNARIQHDEKVESQAPSNMSNQVENKSVSTKRTVVDIYVERDFELEFLKSGILGIEYANRVWDIDGKRAWQQDFLPYVWVHFSGLINHRVNDLLKVGFEFDFHKSRGSVDVKNNLYSNGVLEQRFNFGYEFSFSKESSLFLLGSADLDQIGISSLFEGGNAQFRMKF